MIELFANVTPSSALPSDWALWIILGLVSFIGSVFFFVKSLVKWLVEQASKKADSIISDLKNMHSEGITEVKEIRESQIKTESTLEEIKTDHKETKYAIQTLNTKIKCREAS